MALAYLDENATSAVAANWSDTTGFVDGAELILSDATVGVTDDVSYAGLATGIESFEIQATYNADAAQAGQPFVFDADFSADAFVRHGGPRRFYYDAGGGSGVCNFFYHVGTGASFIEGGTITTLHAVRGTFNANASTVIENATFYNGSHVIANNATGFTSCTIKGGTVISERDGTYVVEAGTLVLDIPDASPTLDVTINQGARVIVRQANVMATVNNDGVLDIQAAKRPVTLGATTHNQGPYAALFRGSLNHTITEPTYIAGFRNAGSPVQDTF